MIAVDQNLNDRKLRSALSRLVGDGTVSGVIPLWYERRATSSGEATYSPGGLSRRAAALFSLSPWDGWASDDEFVICNLIAKFGIYDRILFLTADAGREPNGIGGLLDRIVHPSLKKTNGDRLWLLVLGKLGTISMSSYTGVVVARPREPSPIGVGYAEEWV